jgi:hypothetical protein
VVLRGGGKDTGREQERCEKNHFSKLAHHRLDAGLWSREIFGIPLFSVSCRKVFLWLEFRAGIQGSPEAWGRFKRLSTICHDAAGRG